MAAGKGSAICVFFPVSHQPHHFNDPCFVLLQIGLFRFVSDKTWKGVPLD